MSDKLSEAEKWLPSELLTEEDIIMDSYGVLGSSRFHFTPNFGNNFNSFSSSTCLSSPVESLFCSTETESDEDELTLRNELTRLLTQKKGIMLPVSPHSTLAQMSIWSDRSNGLEKRSPIGPFQVTSPRPVGGNDDAWDLIYRAAMLKNKAGCGGVTFSRNPDILGPPRSLITPPPLKSTCPSAFCHGQVLTPEEYVGSSRDVWNGSGSERIYGRRVGVPNTLAGGFESWSSARPNIQVGLKKQEVREEFGERGGLNLGDGYGFGSGIGVRGLKNERIGTGVFLPRNYGTKSSSNASGTLDSHKKLGGSSARRPSKGINKPSDIAKGAASQLQFGRGITSDNDTFLARKAALLSLQRSGPPRLKEQVAMKHDGRLS